MAEPDDVARQVDSIYKGLLEKFNPAARQLVAAGKAYLKALHGAAACGRTYFEALQKVALQAQERPDLGAPHDIGESLHQLTSVYKELQAQELTALRAFYVDLLVPLETNIEKDVKQLQSEHKRFTSGHKQRREAHVKAAAAVKKNKKKGRARANGVDKQMKHYQALEESKGRLDTYLTQGLLAASQQERRRLGFVLERHCTLSRHHLALQSRGTALLQGCLETWSAVAASRNTPFEATCHPFGGEEMRELEEDAIYSTPSLELCELDSRIRRSRSVDMSALDVDEQRESGGLLPRAISALQLDSARTDDQASNASASPRRCTSSAASGRRPVAKALYNYNAAADTQLSFTEGDTIELIGERADGWQYGENTRTQRKGWFPVAYTEDMAEDGTDSAIGPVAKASCGAGDTVTSWRSAATSETASSNTITSFGTVRAAHHASSPPTSSPASRFTKTSSESYHHNTSSSYSMPQVTANIFPTLLQQQHSKNIDTKKRRDSKDRHNTNEDYSTFGHTGLKYGDRFAGKTTTLLSDSDARSDTSLSLSCSLPGLGSSSSSTSTQRGRVSFHSSNDSGFSNDGSRPTQPTVDYSDADSYRGRCLDMSLASCDTEPLTYFPTRVQGRSYSLGRCEDHLFHKRENSRCKDCLCSCNANNNNGDDAKHNVTLSPSAKKILALRNNRINQKKQKSSLRRSKSLLCLGMNSCRGMPDDLMSNDYEEMFANDWYHRSLIDVCGGIPEPPKHDPPSPPCAECLTSSCSTSCTYCTSTDFDYESKSSQFHHSDRSMPNRVTMKPCKPKKRPPMPLPVEANTPEKGVEDNGPSAPMPSASTPGRVGKPDDKTKRSFSIDYKRESSNIMTKSISRLSRSLTWASPKTSQQNNKQTYVYESNKTAHNNYINSLKNSRQSSSQITTIEECPKTPPLPPRSKNLIPRPSLVPPAREPVNMMTYADFIARRLRCPEGASVLDQESNSGQHMMGKWYDLWDESTSCTEI